MTTKAEMERVLQGQDPVVSALIGYLLAQGWSGDRIVKNVAFKVHSPNQAVVRVTFDSDYRQYWIKGEYTSEGQNVLGACFACIKATSSPAEIAAEMGDFLRRAESLISNSFAVRYLGGKPQGSSARV